LFGRAPWLPLTPDGVAMAAEILVQSYFRSLEKVNCQAPSGPRPLPRKAARLSTMPGKSGDWASFNHFPSSPQSEKAQLSYYSERIMVPIGHGEFIASPWTGSAKWHLLSDLSKISENATSTFCHLKLGNFSLVNASRFEANDTIKNLRNQSGPGL
jgi:hypothetical protein